MDFLNALEMDRDVTTMLRAENASLRAKLAFLELKLDRSERVVVRFYVAVWRALEALGLASLFAKSAGPKARIAHRVGDAHRVGLR